MTHARTGADPRSMSFLNAHEIRHVPFRRAGIAVACVVADRCSLAVLTTAITPPLSDKPLHTQTPAMTFVIAGIELCLTDSNQRAEPPDQGRPLRKDCFNSAST